MTVTIRYFAALREQRGLSHETLTTDARTVGELYDSLALSMPRDLVRFAVGGEFVPADTQLLEGAEIALIPPVAGG
jgi:molybdopterin converting factor subunit 1